MTVERALSGRELEAVRLVAAGNVVKQIGHEMGTTENAINSYLKQARYKTSAKTTSELVAIAVRAGWV